MSLDYPAFALTPEHEALRESVRALADAKIAPHAAKVDQAAEFPWEAHDAIVKAELQAVHIPEAYGGAGADAIATVIVIEEVARACASTSLIPAVNKLGTVPLLLPTSWAPSRCCSPPPRSSSSGTCRRSRAATRCSLARCRSPRQAPTRRPCRRAPSVTGTPTF